MVNMVNVANITMAMADHDTVGIPRNTKLQRIVRTRMHTMSAPYGWRLWIATNDYILGTYIELYDDGRVYTVTVRSDEGDEITYVRPADCNIEDTNTP